MLSAERAGGNGGGQRETDLSRNSPSRHLIGEQSNTECVELLNLQRVLRDVEIRHRLVPFPGEDSPKRIVLNDLDPTDNATMGPAPGRDGVSQ